VDVELIRRFSIILQTIVCGHPINEKKIGIYAFNTAKLYVSKYMPASVHKILIHGEKIIRSAILPIGQLSEEAQEARNKDYKQTRLHHARKCSRSATNEDIVHMLLASSDPLITNIRSVAKKINTELHPEALDLLNFENLE
jgi:hypothetical protein